MVAAGAWNWKTGKSPSVVILNLKGTIIKQFSMLNQWGAPPKWSPNSMTLIICNSQYGMYKLSLENSDVVKLPPDNTFDCNWSPDGQFVVYSTPTGLSIFDMNTQTSNDLLSMENIVAVAWR
jgi:Tol biopolymer transport system component